MRAVSRLILSAVILLLTGILAAVAVYLPELFFQVLKLPELHLLLLQL